MNIPPHLTQLLDIDPVAFEHLPFGAIMTDLTGTITAYNSAEAHLARLDPKRVIGKNFFRDVAPCTAVKEFEGRFQELLASGAAVSETFDFRFTFSHGPVDVAITFVRQAGGNSVVIAVEWIAVSTGQIRR